MSSLYKFWCLTLYSLNLHEEKHVYNEFRVKLITEIICTGNIVTFKTLEYDYDFERVKETLNEKASEDNQGELDS